MPAPRNFDRSGRRFTAPDLPSRMARECPRCGALPQTRCFRLRSWVDDPNHPAGGFYTERAATFHPERRVGDRAAAAAARDDRYELRRRIRQLTQAKLSGSARLTVRRWAESVMRTSGELEVKVAELEAMSDLAW